MICYKPNEVSPSRAERFPSRSYPFAVLPGAIGGRVNPCEAVGGEFIGLFPSFWQVYHGLSHYLQGFILMQCQVVV